MRSPAEVWVWLGLVMTLTTFGRVIIGVRVTDKTSHNIPKLDLQSWPIYPNWYGSKLQVYDPYGSADRKVFGPYTIGKVYLISGALT